MSYKEFKFLSHLECKILKQDFEVQLTILVFFTLELRVLIKILDDTCLSIPA